MRDHNSLRFDPELDASGINAATIDMLDARRQTNAVGLMAMRRGLIDAARVLVDGATELSTPEDVREMEEYQVGFQANSVRIMERMAA